MKNKKKYSSINVIRREKSEMIKMKQELRKKLDFEREKLLKEFEKQKKENKLDLTKYATSYEVDLCKKINNYFYNIQQIMNFSSCPETFP